MAWQGFFSASSSELPRAVDLQLPGEQWLVGMKVLEQDSLLACPGGDVKQQQDFFFSVLSALSPAVTPAEVTGEVAQLKGHISGVGCVCPFPELLLPEQPSPAQQCQLSPKRPLEKAAHVSPGHRLVSAMAPMTQLLKLEPPRC